MTEVGQCRRDHNRLGFAYQLGFVRLFSRFPAQQPLKICDELLSFVSLQRIGAFCAPPSRPCCGWSESRRGWHASTLSPSWRGTLPPEVAKALDGLLEVKEGEAVSGLQAIKANPAKPSAAAMQSLTDKLAAIQATGVLAVDLSWLNANYQRALFHYVRKCPADRLREIARPRHLAALVCFLRQSYRDAVDQAVDMFDKLLTRTHTRAEHELDEQMRGQR